MRRLVGLTSMIVVLMALASVGYTGVRAQDATPVPVPTSMVFVERATTDTTVDNAPTGDSIGDLLAFGNEVFDADNQNKVGDDQGWCIRTKVGEAWECAWTIVLADGQIVTQGPFYDTKSSTMAITGGTGAYTGARGEMLLEAIDATSFRFTYMLQ